MKVACNNLSVPNYEPYCPRALKSSERLNIDQQTVATPTLLLASKNSKSYSKRIMIILKPVPHSFTNIWTNLGFPNKSTNNFTINLRKIGCVKE